MSNSIKLADRIKEISYTMGTGNMSLSGAVAGFSSFGSAYADNDKLFYAVTDGTRYEVGSGIFKTGAQNYIIRFPIKSSSSNSIVDFPEGVKEIYSTYPATHAVYTGSGVDNISTASANGVAFWASSNVLDYDSALTWDKELNRLGINNNSPDYGIHLGGVGPNAMIKSSGLWVGRSGIYFPPSNDGSQSYPGGTQLTHYEKNKLDSQALSEGNIGTLTGSSAVLELSGVANQYILFKPQGAGLVFAGPPSGCTPPCSPAYPSFRQLTPEDLPGVSTSINSLSGILNNKMFTLVGTTNSNLVAASGALNNRITAVSGLFSADGDRGDILVTNNGATWTVDSLAITTGKIANAAITPSKLSFSSPISSIAGGRLVLTAGQFDTADPTSTTDVTGSWLKYVPYNGNRISVFNISTFSWDILILPSVLALNLSTAGLSTNNNYDVFIYSNNGSPALELGTAWSSATTRSTAITTEPIIGGSPRDTNGVYVLSTNASRRYIGTIRTATSTTTADTKSRRLVWNHNSKIRKVLYRTPSSSSWTYTGTTWRNLSGSSVALDMVIGLGDYAIELNAGVLLTIAQSNVTVNYQLGISKDANTTSPLAGSRYQVFNSASSTSQHVQMSTNLVDNVGMGYHSYYPVETTNGAASNTFTLFSDTAGNYFAGIQGIVEC